MKNNIEDIVIKNNKIIVSLDTVLNEALNNLEYKTGVNIGAYNIVDDNIELFVEGNDENITVLKDRLGIEVDEGIENQKLVNIVKQVVSDIVKMTFDTYTLKLKSIDSTEDIVFINLVLDIPTIPHSITITYKIYDDGTTGMGYILVGDVSKEEHWSATSISPRNFLEKLKEIETYYKTKLLNG